MHFDVIEYLNNLVISQIADIEDITSVFDLPMDWRIEYEERAGIMQYDGGLSREEADKRAFSEILERIKGFGGRK